MRFEVKNDGGGKPSWWLYANNNELVAWAGETFASLHNAYRAAAAFKAGAKTARYEFYLDGAGRYRWRAWRSSDKVAASGQAFSSKWSAESAAANVTRQRGERWRARRGLAPPSDKSPSPAVPRLGDLCDLWS